MSTEIQDSVANALRAQSWFVRRKDTIAAVAGTVLQLLNLLVFVTAGAPEWVNAVIAVTVGIAQTQSVLHRPWCMRQHRVRLPRPWRTGWRKPPSSPPR